MMKVNVTANIDPQLIANRVPRANHILALQAQKDTEPFVPALNLHLSNDTKVIDNKIVYPPPYAHYLYVGKLFVDPETGSPWAKYGATKVMTDRNLVFNRAVHGQAQDHWFEASKAVNLDPKWLNVYKKAVGSGA